MRTTTKHSKRAKDPSAAAPSIDARVAALKKVVTRLSLGITDFLQDQAEQARRSSKRTGFYDLTRPLNQATREQAFEEWEAESFTRADQEV